MLKQNVIQARGVSKSFHVRKFSDRRSRSRLRRPLQLARRLLARDPFASDQSSFQALKDVSFDAARGETIGIIGPNGAGKTTLLKILSRVTRPSAGKVEIRGRVGSILELGVGFHPEMTGRENIRLGAAILGLDRKTIRDRQDEIIDFAEVREFIDQPVKRYSSGMFMRLAFSIAACSEPDILLLDEVLAVGDAAFQKKCLARIDRLIDSGRTVIMVSHSPGALRSVCSRALFLDKGRIVMDGPVDAVLDHYLNQDAPPETERIDFPPDPSLPLQILSARLESGPDDKTRLFKCGYRALAPAPGTLLCVEVENSRGITAYYANDENLKSELKRAPGTHQAELAIPTHLLAPGDYRVSFGFWNPGGPPCHPPLARLIMRVSHNGRTVLDARSVPWPSVIYSPNPLWRHAGPEQE